MTSRFAIACCVALASVASAGTINVPADYATIQEAMDASVAGDVIEVAPGTYTGSGSQVVDFNGKAVTLRATGSAADTIIDGENARRGILFDDAETAASALRGSLIRETIPIGASSPNTGDNAG